MKKKLSLFLLLTISITFFIGCAKKDVNELAIATAVGIDLDEDGVKVSAQVFNPNSSGPNPKEVTPSILLTEKARTVQEALRKMTQSVNNRVYFSHFQVLVIGEEIAKKGITPYINFFTINQETLHNFDICIVKNDTAENLLKVPTFLLMIPALSLTQKLESAEENYGTATIISIDDVIYSIHRDGAELAVSTISIIGDVTEKADPMEIDPKVRMAVSGIAAFKDDKLVCYFDQPESIGYNFIRGKIKSTSINVNRDNGSTVAVEILRSSTSMKLKIENGKPKIILKVKPIGDITEDSSGSTAYKSTYTEDVAKRVSYEVKVMIEKAIEKAKAHQTDVFFFGDLIYKKKPKLWEEMIKDYDNLFPQLEVEVIVEAEIQRVKP